MDFKNAMVYVKDSELLGDLAMIDFVEQTLIINVDEKAYEVHFDDAEILKDAFEFHGINIFDKDILSHSSGDLFIVERVDKNKIRINSLDKDLNVAVVGALLDVDSLLIDELEENFDLYSSYYALVAEKLKNPDFNVKVMKSTKIHGELRYYYALNNKELKHIDLINVMFLNETIVDNVEYTRTTVSYDVYKQWLLDGVIKDVSESELNNYVTGATYKADTNVVSTPYEPESKKSKCDSDTCEDFSCECVSDDEFVEDLEISIRCNGDCDDCEECEDNEYDICTDCGNQVDYCTCDLW